MSLYRGIVTNVEDPEGLLRLKAMVPGLFGSSESNWIWPSIPVAMGVQVPPIGSPVWIALEGGDPTRPVWVGTWRTRPQGGIDPDLIFGGVVGETTYGLSPDNGTVYTVSRSDHTHGSPSLTGSTPTTAAFGDAAVVGTGTTPARSDHKHGIPVNPVPAHEAAGDPHPVYSTDADLVAHAATPHGSAGDVSALETIFWSLVNP